MTTKMMSLSSRVVRPACRICNRCGWDNPRADCSRASSASAVSGSQFPTGISLTAAFSDSGPYCVMKTPARSEPPRYSPRRNSLLTTRPSHSFHAFGMRVFLFSLAGRWPIVPDRPRLVSLRSFLLPHLTRTLALSAPPFSGRHIVMRQFRTSSFSGPRISRLTVPVHQSSLRPQLFYCCLVDPGPLRMLQGGPMNQRFASRIALPALAIAALFVFAGRMNAKEIGGGPPITSTVYLFEDTELVGDVTCAVPMTQPGANPCIAFA